MKNHQSFLLTCLDYENACSANNKAERALRLKVVMRKIFGGSRSKAGAKAHAINSSVIETALQRNPDVSFFEAITTLFERRNSELWRDVMQQKLEVLG